MKIENVYLIVITVIASMSGILLCCLYNELISIRISAPGFSATPVPHNPIIEKKRIVLSYWHKDQLKQEADEIPWTSDTALNAACIMAHWLNLLDEEDILQKPIDVQSATISEHKQELFMSLNRSPLESESSTYDKYQLIESFLQTLIAARIPIQNVRFLVDHLPLQDTHLDFSQSWPLQGFSLDLKPQIEKAELTCPSKKPLTIMISAAGDAQKVGRSIGDSFERGLALQCAEGVVKSIQEALPGCRVLLAKTPGTGMDDLQGASFANRYAADVLISIHCFYQPLPQRTLDVYYFSLNPVQDAYHKSGKDLAFRSEQQAYLPYYASNKKLANLFSILTKNDSSGGLSMRATMGLPFKPLLGIAVPAIACELGLQTTKDLKTIIPTLSQVVLKVAACTT